MNPCVFLIVPVYNAMPYLNVLLDSIRAQTYRPLECIFVDDGSKDESLSVLQAFVPALEKAGITCRVIHKAHEGQAAAFNDALFFVSDGYLTWCDADDYMLPQCIEQKAKYLAVHPEIGLVRNDGLLFLGDGPSCARQSSRPQDQKTQNIFHDLLWQKTYCYAGCYMVRVSLFRECYPSMTIPVSAEGQNLQLLLPPASRSDCGFVPDILHHYYCRPSGHSSRKRSFTEHLARIKNFTELTLHVLPFCDCDQERYRQEIYHIEKQRIRQLNYSLMNNIKEKQESESRNSDIS